MAVKVVDAVPKAEVSQIFFSLGQPFKAFFLFAKAMGSHLGFWDLCLCFLCLVLQSNLYVNVDQVYCSFCLF